MKKPEFLKTGSEKRTERQVNRISFYVSVVELAIAVNDRNRRIEKENLEKENIKLKNKLLELELKEKEKLVNTECKSLILYPGRDH